MLNKPGVTLNSGADAICSLSGNDYNNNRDNMLKN